ncbi:NAD(P)-dependent oxidoreductase [Hymenobacter busanensis]|uniref:NAD(P)-dependent oxidoreductase n=1 Tax=Hymenobacter busanensis TaxID=2607656 RepID=A0A7L4ZSH1_9BACT|nr:NAD(P)-dependent oxidoreductase [Hymenobacter busanensis]KAA9325881.1 NAD(P)-dependent oxidoreductase [Hymenobacter busanensis]QHJ06279.1 NAD(P)H-binding protein [Hymenobacter busanensis]
MNIALLGATGFVGSNLLREALQRGHQVTAIVRDPSKITEQPAGLTVVPGDVNQPAQLAEQLKGHDVVVNAFNAGWTNPNLYDDSLTGNRAIEKATEQAGVPRLVVIGGAGSLYIGDAQLVDGPQFPAEYKPGATAARDYLTELRKNDKLDWTFVSPAIEMHQGIDTGRTGQYRLGTENPVFNEQGRSILSGEDLAVAVLDEVEKHQFSRQRFTAAY